MLDKINSLKGYMPLHEGEAQPEAVREGAEASTALSPSSRKTAELQDRGPMRQKTRPLTHTSLTSSKQRSADWGWSRYGRTGMITNLKGSP